MEYSKSDRINQLVNRALKDYLDNTFRYTLDVTLKGSYGYMFSIISKDKILMDNISIKVNCRPMKKDDILKTSLVSKWEVSVTDADGMYYTLSFLVNRENKKLIQSIINRDIKQNILIDNGDYNKK